MIHMLLEICDMLGIFLQFSASFEQDGREAAVKK
jgi:hypothetical protein